MLATCVNDPCSQGTEGTQTPMTLHRLTRMHATSNCYSSMQETLLAHNNGHGSDVFTKHTCHGCSRNARRHR